MYYLFQFQLLTVNGPLGAPGGIALKTAAKEVETEQEPSVYSPVLAEPHVRTTKEGLQKIVI